VSEVTFENLDEAECLRLMVPGGIGRLVFAGRAPADHLDSESERAEALEAGVDPWPGGDREHFISITPARVTGRRIRREQTT
jgi:hypothetical protein